MANPTLTRGETPQGPESLGVACPVANILDAEVERFLAGEAEATHASVADVFGRGKGFEADAEAILFTGAYRETNG